MRRLAAGVLVLPLLVACGTEDSLDAAAQQHLEEVQADAERASEAVRALRSRVAELEASLDREGDSAREARDELDAVAERLWASLRKVRTSIRDADGSAADAADAAAGALATAQAAAKDLSVLQGRFEYHLSHEHGDGS